MLKRLKNQAKKQWILRSKSRKIDRKTFPKNMFFSTAFFYQFWEGLGKVLGGFGEGFGGSWRLLGRFWASFLGVCIWSALWKGSWGLLGSILGRFGGVWGGSGEGFGRPKSCTKA